MKMLTTALLLNSLSLFSPAKADSHIRPEASKVIEFKSGQDGFDTRTFFYVTSEEVIAIDSQFTPKLAEDSIKHLRKFTDKPITTLIITHPNPDKFNGASAFKKLGAQVISSKATSEAIPRTHQYKQYYFVEMAKMFTKETYPTPIEVNETFTGEKKLILKNKEEVLLKELKLPGVSSTQTAVFFKAQNALFVGDLVHHKAHAWLEGGIVAGAPVPTVDGWIKDLEELKRTFKSNPIVYGGRGENASLYIAARAQIDYLKKSVSIIKKQIAESKFTKADLNTDKAAKFYGDLEGKFKKAFPHYELSYMITYGSYGLVQSLLK